MRTGKLGWLMMTLGIIAGFAFGTWRMHGSAATASTLATQQQAEPTPAPRKLFSIPYGGEKLEHIGVVSPDSPPEAEEGQEAIGDEITGSCPLYFCVSRDGQRFYFLDTSPQSKCKPDDLDERTEETDCWWIKVFDRHGRLVQAIPYEQGRFESLTVDDQGRLYAIGDQILVFDRQGQLDKERSRRLTAQWEEILKRIEELEENDPPSGVRSSLTVRYLTVDRTGNLHVDFVRLEGELYTLRLNADGTGPRLLPFGVPDWQGNVWEIVMDTPYETATERVYYFDGTVLSETEVPLCKPRTVTVYDKDANVVRSFRMPTPELRGYERRISYDTDRKIDGRGHFYVVVLPLEIRVELRGDVAVEGPLFIVEYDSEGHLVGKRATIRSPSFDSYWSFENEWDVDHAGNLYYLEFQKDRVDVMMAPPAPVRR